MRSSFTIDLADWFHQSRDMLMWAGIGVVGLVVGITWYGLAQSSPIRAAEHAVQEALGQPGLTLKNARMERYPGYRQWLVCATVAGDPARPVAAVVRKRRRGGALSMLTPRDRVRRLALPEWRTPDAAQAELLAACAERR